jgi:hypothetical protein
MEASKRADFVKKIHEKTREAIENKGKNTAATHTSHESRFFFSPAIWYGCTCTRTDFPCLGAPSLDPEVLVPIE